VVDLLAFVPELPKRLRRSRAHAPLLADFSPPTGIQRPNEPAPDREDRPKLEVLRVLSCGVPLQGAELHAVSDGVMDDAQDLELPLLLVAGELRVATDELEALRIGVAVAKPLAAGDKRLAAALTVATDALAGSALTPETAVSLLGKLDAATRELSLPPRYLIDIVERTVLETRSYKRRTLLGAARLRGDLTVPSLGAIPVYLPESVATLLPLLPSFPAMLLAELRPREDASETHAESLLALAVGRVLQTRA
jgi:hypothetical protein